MIVSNECNKQWPLLWLDALFVLLLAKLLQKEQTAPHLWPWKEVEGPQLPIRWLRHLDHLPTSWSDVNWFHLDVCLIHFWGVARFLTPFTFLLILCSPVLTVGLSSFPVLFYRRHCFLKPLLCLVLFTIFALPPLNIFLAHTNSIENFEKTWLSRDYFFLVPSAVGAFASLAIIVSNRTVHLERDTLLLISWFPLAY